MQYLSAERLHRIPAPGSGHKHTHYHHTVQIHHTVSWEKNTDKQRSESMFSPPNSHSTAQDGLGGSVCNMKKFLQLGACLSRLASHQESTQEGKPQPLLSTKREGSPNSHFSGYQETHQGVSRPRNNAGGLGMRRAKICMLLLWKQPSKDAVSQRPHVFPADAACTKLPQGEREKWTSTAIQNCLLSITVHNLTSH